MDANHRNDESEDKQDKSAGVDNSGLSLTNPECGVLDYAEWLTAMQQQWYWSASSKPHLFYCLSLYQQQTFTYMINHMEDSAKLAPIKGIVYILSL